MAERPERRRRLPWLLSGIVAVLVVAGVIVGLTVHDRSGTNAAPGSAYPVQTATVERTNLAETTPESGTVGFADPVAIVQPGGNGPGTLTKDQQAVASAQQAVAADRTAVAQDQLAGQESVDQADQALQADEATLASDRSTLQSDQATLGAAQAKEDNDCQGDAAAGSGAQPSGGSSGAGSGSSSQCSADQAQVQADQAKVDQDQATVGKDETAVASAQAGVASAGQKENQTASQDQSRLSADQASLGAAQEALASDSAQASIYGPDSTYTALPAVGQVIRPGQSLWSVDGEPVPLLPGVLSPWRAFRAGMTPGPDVATLDRALIQLGYGAGLTPSDSFSPATSAAIERLQSALGLPVTGRLDLGSVVFEPTAMQVTSVTPTVGDAVMAGATVLAATSTTPIVTVALPVTQSYLVAVGDTVSVELPDGTTASGTIATVGTVATSTSDNSNGNDQPSATIDITVDLSHASSAGSLDGAPVTVDITNQSADNVLAVPTTALLALAGGGYALEVVEPGGAHRLEAVTTGLFDDQSGLVQVSGPEVAVGQKVVVASS